MYIHKGWVDAAAEEIDRACQQLTAAAASAARTCPGSGPARAPHESEPGPEPVAAADSGPSNTAAMRSLDPYVPFMLTSAGPGGPGLGEPEGLEGSLRSLAAGHAAVPASWSIPGRLPAKLDRLRRRLEARLGA